MLVEILMTIPALPPTSDASSQASPPVSAETRSTVLREFGTPVLEDAQGTVLQRGGKPLLVLLWLLHASPRRASREEVCRVFWPDDPPENARRSLRQALVQHRRWLGPEAVCVDEDRVWIAPGAVELESRRFLEAIRDGRHHEAWACYRDPWALDAERVGGDRLEPWVFGQREGLAREFMALATHAVQGALATGDLSRAAELAAVAVAAEPRREPLVLLLAEALQAVGAFGQARNVLEQFVALHAGSAVPVSPLVRRQLARLASDHATIAEGESHHPGERLVGREREIAMLWRVLALARSGRPQRMVITAAPGLGKTRLLDEVESRLSTYALQVVRVRLTADVPMTKGAALSEYVRALSTRRGASGVNAAAAEVLVQLVPELIALYPGVPATAGSPSEQVAAAAVAELLETVAEERATVLLVDDMHCADAWSHAVWHALAVTAPVALLEVVTARLEFSTPPEATSLSLAPFGPAETRALFASVATVPDAPWADTLLSVLLRQTGGVPRALVRALRTLDAQGVLVVRGGRWSAPTDVALFDAVQEAVNASRWPSGEAAMRLLTVLRAWGRALPESVLMAVAGTRWPEMERVSWSPGLRSLEREGFIWRQGGAWIADDTPTVPVGDAASVEGSPRFDQTADQETARLLLLLVDQLFRGGSPAPGEVAHLARRAGACGSFGVAASLVRHVASGTHLQTLGVKRTALAAHIAVAAGVPAWEPALRRSMGLTGRRSRRALTLLGAGIATVVVACGVLLVVLQPRLVVEVPPMPANGAEWVSLGFAVQPRVVIRDGFGRLRPLHGVPVQVRGVRAQLDGDTARLSEGGRVQFEALTLSPDREELLPPDAPPVQLTFRGPWWMRKATIDLPGLWWRGKWDHFRVVKASVNGRAITPGSVASLQPGEDSVVVVMTIEFSTRVATANYVLGAAPLWLPRETSVVRVAGLPRPVIDAWSTVRFAVPAPSEPGRHAIIMAMGADDSVDHFFSGTTWLVGSPRWYDGNDLHDLRVDQRAHLRDSGWVFLSGALTAQYARPQGAVVGSQQPDVVGTQRRDPENVTMSDRIVRGTVLDLQVGR